MNTVMPAQLMITDYVIVSFLVLFIISGWLRGLVRSLIGPLALVTSALASSLYFGVNRDISNSIFFVLIGTILLTVLGYLALYYVRQTVPAENRDYIFWLSRLLGILVTVAWRGGLIGAALILLTALPPTIFGLKETQTDIKQSVTYHALDSIIISKVQVVRDIREFLSCLEDPQRAQAIQATEEFKTLMQDQRMQELLADPQVVDEINSKDAVRLALNKKVVQLIDDTNFVRKFLAFTEVLYQSRKNTAAPAQ